MSGKGRSLHGKPGDIFYNIPQLRGALKRGAKKSKRIRVERKAAEKRHSEQRAKGWS